MKKIDDPESFEKGDTREELTALGEGQKIVVVGYLLRAKPELGGESCNCGLQTVAETDNHLVLGRRVLCTDRHVWSTGRIVHAFRGQWNVEELFRRAKKGGVVPRGPSHQWADSSLRLHRSPRSSPWPWSVWRA
jgi:hypothetical protein